MPFAANLCIKHNHEERINVKSRFFFLQLICALESDFLKKTQFGRSKLVYHMYVHNRHVCVKSEKNKTHT